MGWRANALGSFAILAVIAAISYGLPAVDRAVPDDRPVAAGRPLTVGHRVTLVPPRGSVLDSAETSPQQGRLALDVRGARFEIRASPYQRTLDEAADRLRQRIAALPGHQLTGRTYHVSIGDGVIGLEGRFSSAKRDGYFAVFVSAGRVVEVVAHGVDLALSETLESIRASVATLRFEGSA